MNADDQLNNANGGEIQSTGELTGELTGDFTGELTGDLMLRALELARAATVLNEVPVGCVIFDLSKKRIIGAGHNRRIIDRDPTAHAEIVAMRQAAIFRGDWRLSDCVLCVTLEPCIMCAGAIINARIPRLIFGALDAKGGAVESVFQLCSDPRLNHRVEVVGGVMALECGEVLTSFFRTQRDLGKK